MVDTVAGHQRVVIRILSVRKGGGVLDRCPSHATQAVEIEWGNVALWPNRWGMGRNRHLSLNRGVPCRDHRWDIGDNLDAIGSGEQGACCHCLGIRGGIIERLCPLLLEQGRGQYRW